MTLEAVAEKPAAVAADDKPENPAPLDEAGLEAERVEDAPLQPADNPDDAAKSDDTPATEDEGERLEREAREAEIERRAEEKAAALVAKSKATDAETVRQQAVKARTGEINLVTGGFGSIIAQLDANLKEAGYEDEDVRKDILAPLNGHNGKLKPLFTKFYDNAILELKDELNNALAELVPDREKWLKETEGEIEIADGLKTFVELSALSSDAVRKAKPEELIAANKALDAYIKRELDAKYKAGRKNPYPDGEPDTTGAAARGSDPTYEQLTKMTEAQIRALPPGVQARVIAKAISEG